MGYRQKWTKDEDLIIKKNQNLRPKQITNLLNGRTCSRESDIYIVDSEKVAECCKYSHQIWLKFPNRKGEKHKDTNMRMLLHDYDKIRTKQLDNWQDFLQKDEIDFIKAHPQGWLDKYKEAWEIIKA